MFYICYVSHACHISRLSYPPYFYDRSVRTYLNWVTVDSNGCLLGDTAMRLV
jgi:hypothetical protein